MLVGVLVPKDKVLQCLKLKRSALVIFVLLLELVALVGHVNDRVDLGYDLLVARGCRLLERVFEGINVLHFLRGLVFVG